MRIAIATIFTILSIYPIICTWEDRYKYSWTMFFLCNVAVTLGIAAIGAVICIAWR